MLFTHPLASREFILCFFFRQSLFLHLICGEIGRLLIEHGDEREVLRQGIHDGVSVLAVPQPLRQAVDFVARGTPQCLELEEEVCQTVAAETVPAEKRPG